jgi:hypothetical protein
LASQLPLIGFTVLWRLEGIRVRHLDLEHALQSAGFELRRRKLSAPAYAARVKGQAAKVASHPLATRLGVRGATTS